jgi:hypothetical protein
MKALEKDPAARFQSAREMILALTAAVEIFEKDTVINKVYTHRTHKPELRAISPPPSTPRGEGESGEEQVPSPAATALSRPEETAVAGPRRSTPRDAEEKVSGRQPILSFSALRFGRWLSVIGRKQVWIGTAALLVVVLALLRVWVSSSRPPTITPRPESNPSAGSKVQEPKQPLGGNPTGAESQNETRHPTSLPPSPQRETTPAARGATATRQAIKPPSPPKAPPQSRGLSPDEQARLKDKLATASFYMDHGDYDMAVQTYDAALEIDPTSMQAREGLRKGRQLLDILKNKKKE